MIINGGARCNRFFFAKHLTKTEQNENVKIAEIRGFASKTPNGCFREMEAISLGTRAKNYFYHANLNTLAHEKLTPEQWERAADLLEKELGLEGQPRFIVEHDKKGRVHRHAVWLRIDVDHMKAIPNQNDYYAHQEVSRQLEKEFGLTQVQSVLGEDIEKGNRPERNPKPWETFRGQVSGIDVKEMKQEVSELWQAHKKGQNFLAALESKGYIVARGDSRNYCLVDQAGDIHSLARRLPKEVRAADVKEKFSDISPQSLPHVKEAVALQRSRFKDKDMDGGTGGQNEQDMNPAEREEARQKREITREEKRVQEAIKTEGDRIKTAVEAEEKRKIEFKEQVEKETELAEEMEAKHRQYIEFRQEMDKRAEGAQQAEEERRKGGQQREEGGIRSADTRYAIALGDNYNMASPYTSLSRASMAEYSAFMRDRERLTGQIAEEQDPAKRHKLELQRDIESAEYMAITSRRIGRMSEVTQGKEAPETVRQYERAEQFKEQAQALRKEYREFGAEREQLPPEQSKGNRKEEKVALEQEKSSLKVEMRNPKPQPGSEQNLTDFVKGLPEKEASKRVTKEEAAKNPEARKAYYKQQTEERNRTAALNNISSNLKTGKNLSKDDIKQLSKEDLKGIEEGGDQHLKNLAKQHEQTQEKGRSRGR